MTAGSRQGQSGLFIVFNLTLLFAVIGLSADVGVGYLARQQAQTAADSAATAAAMYASQNGYTCGSGGVICGAATACANPNVYPPTNNLQAGCLYAAANGYLNGGNGGKQVVTMTGNTTTPPGVAGNTAAYWVQANISDYRAALFGLFAGVNSFVVNAVSTAGITITSPGACVYVLASGNVANAFVASGSATVTAACGIFVNSGSSSAFVTSGSSTVHSTTIQVVGGTSVSGATVTPTPTTGVASFSDPLATLPMPAFTGCNFTNYSLGNGGVATISPGVYCGGISLSGSAQLTLNPGTYVLNGAGLTMSGSSSIKGTHVTLFNTGQSGQTASPISNTGSSVMNLTAPNSGTYQGMLFVQDRNLTYSGTNSFTGSTNSVLTGTLYFPSTKIAYAGASTTGSYTAIVAKTISFTGNSSLKNDPTGTYTGLAVRGTSLIN